MAKLWCMSIAVVAAGLSKHTARAFLTKEPIAHRTSSPSLIRRSMSSSSTNIAKRVLVPIADGSEEIETTCITDTLVRFGADVTIASAMPNHQLVCKMSRHIQFQADISMADLDATTNTNAWDLIVLPGGMPGAEHLRDCQPLQDLLRQQQAAGKLYGAICAAPAVALGPLLAASKTKATITCYPAPPFRQALADIPGLTIANDDEAVVVSDNLVTSQGPGTALAFALQLGELLYGKEKRDEIAAQMLC